jgi:shikimate kinase
MKNNIVLTGFMGTGKTAVGQALAKRLNRQFIEVDSKIEQMAGKSISDIFKDNGEIYFRELEIGAINKPLQGKNRSLPAGAASS